MREQVRAALDGAEPNERTGALIALLSALGAVTTVIEVTDKRAAKRRAKEIAEGQWAAAAVRKAVEAVNAAMIAAITAAGTSAATS